MKENKLIAFIAAIFIGLLIFGETHGDTGWEGATRKECGQKSETYQVTGTSYTGTAVFAASIKRPDGAIFNNTSSTVWVGSVTATSVGTTIHNNIARGFPILSSATYSMGGNYTGGDLSVTCDKGVSTCEIRTHECLVP